VVLGVFIALEPCHVDEIEGPESYFLLISLMRDKYHLHNINKEQISLT